MRITDEEFEILRGFANKIDNKEQTKELRATGYDMPKKIGIRKKMGIEATLEIDASSVEKIIEKIEREKENVKSEKKAGKKDTCKNAKVEDKVVEEVINEVKEENEDLSVVEEFGIRTIEDFKRNGLEGELKDIGVDPDITDRIILSVVVSTASKVVKLVEAGHGKLGVSILFQEMKSSNEQSMKKEIESRVAARLKDSDKADCPSSHNRRHISGSEKSEIVQKIKAQKESQSEVQVAYG